MIRNTHVRTLDCPAPAAGAVLDTLAGPDDAVWPSPQWPPMKLDRPLGVGAAGGHGPIRYTVAEYEPGRRVRFEFGPRFASTGWHEFRVEPITGDRCRVVHDMTVHPRGSMRLAWPLAIRWLHDALVEDALDNVERATTGVVRTPNRWSLWVRVMRGRSGRRHGVADQSWTSPAAMSTACRTSSSRG
ncbi:SRPBCC family protein [Cryptosporangium phraense]|uniref:SRPBCC family protein n=1 Tax=Cryptosporangium phraense TaxID=2593070 RepID=A0A545ARM8_9ACTN|nr:SRPBCC family protein [Cryptosporangium phraense]TQS43994.1 SRPBCC family protein [Cryptosporangium phraense]